MNDLIKKLNLLMSARLRSGLALRPNHRSRNSDSRLDDNLATLRAHLNDAIAYEATIQSQIDRLEADIVAIDAQADAAVVHGDDSAARRAIAQIKSKQAQIAQTQRDLREHQDAVALLTAQINAFERAAVDHMSPDAAPTTPGITIPPLADTPSRADTPSGGLIDEDLEQRRRRLSKP